MKTIFRYGFVFILTCVSFLSLAEAGEWTIVGPRALGMGGANVAVANDATASYWNPGAFGLFSHPTGGDYGKRDWSLQLPEGGVGLQSHENFGEEFDKLSKFDFGVLNNGTISVNNTLQFIGLVNALNSFGQNKNRAITLTRNAGTRFQMGHSGIGGYVFVDVSAKPSLDTVNIFPVSAGSTGVTVDQFTNPVNYGCDPCNEVAGGLTPDQSIALRASLAGLDGWTQANADNFVNAMDNGLSQIGVVVPADIVPLINSVASLANTAFGGGSLADNTSKLLFKGIAIDELPITYGRAVTDDFAIGGNIKYMKARVYDVAIPILKENNESDAFNNAFNKARATFTEEDSFGIDLGLLYSFGDDLRVGLVGRNLNNPTFGSFKEKQKIRAGFAYKPIGFITLAGDMDLTENDTTIGSDYKSKNIAGGFEINLLKTIFLRGGAYKNRAQDDIGLVYTAGIGINLWVVMLDIGATMSDQKTKIDGKEVPEEAKVEFALSFLF